MLGCNIARQLVDAKEVVRALVLKDDPAVAYVPDQVQIIYGDLLDINSMEELFTVPEGEEAERILSIPLNISVAASAIVDASGYSDRN